MFNPKNVICLLLLLISYFIVSCGQCNTAGSESGSLVPLGTVQDLVISAPAQYPAGESVIVPVVVTNTKVSFVKNIAYSIINNTTNAELYISPDQCVNIGPNADCVLNVEVPNSSMPGAFAVSASPNAAISQVTNKLKSLFGEPSKDVITSTFVGLISSSANIASGINGINNLSPTYVMGEESSGTIMQLTFRVGDNAGGFNTIQILDVNGNVIPSVAISGNSGAALSVLAPGSIVTLAITIPAGAKLYNYKLQTLNTAADGSATVVDTASNTNTINVGYKSNTTATLTAQPSYFALTESNLTQVVTVSNPSSTTASNLNTTLRFVNPFISIQSGGYNPCGSTLAAGASCTYIVSLAEHSIASGSGSSGTAYDSAGASANVNFTYKGDKAIGGLVLNLPNTQFAATTIAPTSTQLLTLTNSGNVPLLSLILDASNSPYYTLDITAGGVANNCAALLASTDGIPVDVSCLVSVVYTNATPVAVTNSTLVLDYTYFDGANNINANTSAATNYQTTLTQAVITISNIADFASILNNNFESSVQTVTITNNGNYDAENIVFTLSNPAFTIIGTPVTMIAKGESITLTLQFGPGTVLSAESANLSVSYLATPSLNASITSNEFGGTFIKASAANLVISSSYIANAGWLGGNGSTSTPFVQQGGFTTPATITYTISNTNAAATSVYVNTSTITSPWSVQSNNCGTSAQQSIALGASGSSNSSCTIVFQLNSITGANSISTVLTPVVTANWTDQAHPMGTNVLLSSANAYVTVYAAPKLTTKTNPSPLGKLAQYQSFTVTSYLTGGYAAASQTVSASLSGDINNYIIESGGATCTINASTPCTINFYVKGNTQIASESVVVNIANTSLPSNAPTPSSYPLSIVKNNVGPYSVTPIMSSVAGESVNLSLTFGAVGNYLYPVMLPPVPYTINLPESITTTTGGLSSYTCTTSPCNESITIGSDILPGVYPITVIDQYGNSYIYNLMAGISSGMLYMATYTGIYSCQFNVNGGNIIGAPCARDPRMTLNTSAVAINASGAYAYVSGRFSGNNHQIAVCQINSSTGKFNSCNLVTIPGLSMSFAAVVNQQQTKLYLGSYYNASVYACDISPTNPNPTNCVAKVFGAGISRMNMNSAGDTLMVTVDQTYIYSCGILPNGNVGSCSSYSISSGNGYSGIAFNYNDSSLFVAGSNGAIVNTPYNPVNRTIDGSFSNGIQTAIPSSYTWLTGLYFGATYALISSAVSPSGMLFCSMATPNGLIAQCNPWAQVGNIKNVDGFAIFN